MGILAAVILLIATNAALIGLSRLTFSMGQYRQLPEALRQVHPKFKTPYVALIVFSGVAMLVMAPGETTFLGTIYAFGATLSFTVAHVSVIRLRKLRPVEGRPKASDGSRLWLSPGNVRIGGVEVPVLAVIGGIGTFAAFVVACVLDLVVLATGGGWMIVGTIGYVVYRRNQGLPLTKTVKVAHLAPLGVEEPEYQSIVVVFEDDPFNEEMVAMAKALAAKRRRAIHVVSLITVPTDLPARRGARRRGGRRAGEDRAGEADLRPARDGLGRAGSPRPGRRDDREVGEGAGRGGDRDAASLPGGCAGVFEDAPGRDGKAPVPRACDGEPGGGARGDCHLGARLDLASMPAPRPDEVYRGATRVMAVVILVLRAPDRGADARAGRRDRGDRALDRAGVLRAGRGAPLPLVQNVSESPGERDSAPRGSGGAMIFAVAYSAVGFSLYFSLGVVADYGLGLTPLLFLGAGFMFVLATLTYAEGGSMFVERGGSSNMARYAFNELVSFIAGWALLIDFIVVVALAAVSAPHYLSPIWDGFGEGTGEVLTAVAIVVGAALVNVLGLVGLSAPAPAGCARDRRHRRAAALDRGGAGGGVRPGGADAESGSGHESVSGRMRSTRW